MQRKPTKANPAPDIEADFDEILRDHLFDEDDFDDGTFNDSENQISQTPDSRNEPLPPEIFYEAYETEDEIANNELLQPEVIEPVESTITIPPNTSNPTQVTAVDQTLVIKPVWQLKYLSNDIPIALSDYTRVQDVGNVLMVNDAKVCYMLPNKTKLNESGYPAKNGITANTYRIKHRREAPWYKKPNIYNQSTIAHVWQARHFDGRAISDEDHFNIRQSGPIYRLNDDRVRLILDSMDCVNENGDFTEEGIQVKHHRSKYAETAPWKQARTTLNVDASREAPSHKKPRKKKPRPPKPGINYQSKIPHVWQAYHLDGQEVSDDDHYKIKPSGRHYFLNDQLVHLKLDKTFLINESGNEATEGGLKAQSYRTKHRTKAPWYQVGNTADIENSRVTVPSHKNLRKKKPQPPKPSINHQSEIPHVWQVYRLDGMRIIEVSDDDHFKIKSSGHQHMLDNQQVTFKLELRERIDVDGNLTREGGIQAKEYRSRFRDNAPWNQGRKTSTIDSDNSVPSSDTPLKKRRQDDIATDEDDQTNKQQRTTSDYSNSATLFTATTSQESAQLQQEIREVLYTGTSIELENYLSQLHWYVVGDFEGQKPDSQVIESIMDIINSGKDMVIAAVLSSPEYTYQGEPLLTWYWHKILGDNLIPTRDLTNTFNPALQAEQIQLQREQLCSILSEVIITDQSLQFSDINTFMQFANLYQSLNPGDIGLGAELIINPEDQSFQIPFANKNAFDEFYAQIINIELDPLNLGHKL